MLKLLILNIKTLNKSLSKYCTSDSVSSGLIAIYPLRRTEAYSTFYSTFKHVDFSAHIKLTYIIVSESLYYLFQDQLLTAYPADV